MTINVVAIDTAGGGLDFRVPIIGMRLRIGAKVTHNDTHSIRVKLVPQAAKEYEVRGGDVQRVLVDAIETIRAIIRRAQKGHNPFELDDGAVELTFAVTREGTISLGADGELRDEATHTLKLVVGPSE